MNNVFNKKIGFALVAVTLLVMGAFYIYQVNDLVGSVYERDQRQEKLTELREEIKRSEVTVSRSQSLTQIDEAIKERGFESVGEVQYVQVSDTQVAAAQ